MTYDETLKIMTILKVAYPHNFKGMTKQEAIAMSNLWAKMFENDLYEVVCEIVHDYISTDEKGFFPTIGVLKKKVTGQMKNVMFFKQCLRSQELFLLKETQEQKLLEKGDV